MSWKEKQFEEKMQPFINDIYNNIFSNLINIDRSKRDNNKDYKKLFLDKELGIDTVLTFKDGSIITIQEKTRKFNFAAYNDFTFEYYNDPKIKDKGEWFKLASQFYFYGYANEDENGYLKYWFINVGLLRLELNKINLLKYLKANRPPAKANFYAIPFNLLEKFNNVVFIKK